MSFAGIGPVVLVGAGKMGLALAQGWVAGGLSPGSLTLIDPHPSEAALAFASDNGGRVATGPGTVPARVLVLAVKPQIIGAVMAELRPIVSAHTLVISIAAGIPMATLSEALGTQRVVRAMPNTPAQLGKGITGAVALSIDAGDRQAADALLGATGGVVWFEMEAMIDVVTAVSGSGPAYVFNMVEALAAAGERQGLTSAQAMQLARATIVGAAALLEADPSPASVLRQNVTSPNGTTAAALTVLMGADGLSPLMDRAVDAARKRSEELGRAAK